MDAAIAAQMVLTVVEPESSGIGGGAFMLLWDPAKKKMTSFDGRETAPASATPTMFLDANGQPRAKMDAIPGGLSVGIPGVVAMLGLAHSKYGKLPWPKLLWPAITLAQNGFAVPKKLAFTLKEYPQLAKMPDIKRHFFHTDGTPYAEGETMTNLELAAIFRLIARRGPDVFYHGPIANQIAYAVQHAPINPGGMTANDIAQYKAVERVPVCGFYRKDKVCSMGPPSSGGIAVIQMLETLERFPPKQLATDTLEGVHLFTQASRLAFADRGEYLGDPAFVNVPVSGLLNRTYLAQRSKLIDPKKDMGTALPGNPPRSKADHASQRSPRTSRHQPYVHRGRQGHGRVDDDDGGRPVRVCADGQWLHPRQSAHRFLVRARI